MNYKKVVAYNPETSVLFELEDGTFALVSLDEDDKYLITVTKYAESHLKFGGFVSGDEIPEEILKKAVKTLKKEARVYMSRDLDFK